MADNCRSCQAPVRWVLTTTGRRMPIDPDPVEGGNLELVEGADFATVRVVASAQEGLLPEPRYVSHFVTCPDAEEHRRG